MQRTFLWLEVKAAKRLRGKKKHSCGNVSKRRAGENMPTTTQGKQFEHDQFFNTFGRKYYSKTSYPQRIKLESILSFLCYVHFDGTS